jgi:AraC family transcriptional regulator
VEYATVNSPESVPFAREFAASVNAVARIPLKTFDFSIASQKVAVDEYLEVTKTSRLAAHDNLVVLYCDRGSTLSVAQGLCSLWSPLRGDLSISEGGSRLSVSKGFAYVADTNRRYEAAVSPAGACLAIVGSQRVWSAINAFGNESFADGPAIFPAIHSHASTQRRTLIRFARECFADARRQEGVARQISMLSAVVCQLQRCFDEQIDRCPGRTVARRRSVFLRLQRARFYIMLHNAEDMDVSMLANIASYSPWQFIKIFNQVFGKTPYAYLSQYRVEVAKNLLKHRKMMGVFEVARAAGFSSRSTFTRTMKQTMGICATEFRANNVPSKPEAA